jgi:hypothetical protein
MHPFWRSDVTTNDQHLEKHEQKGGDQPLAGAQITKAEDSAVKQRQEMLDGLKSHRITKEGNSSFVIDMGNGETVQDVRAASKVAHIDAKSAQGILPGEGDYMPKTDDTSSPPFIPGGLIPGKPDVPLPELPLPGKLTFPPSGNSDFPIPGDWSKLTVKTDTTIDKQGHFVTTETRADGSTLATTQEIGSDSKLHAVSTVLKEANGDTTTEKFDPATGKKTEEIKDTGVEKTDTKFNTNGLPTSKDTTNGLTGHTDHENWLYFSSGECAVHMKNGELLIPRLNNIETLRSVGTSERAAPAIEDQYYLKQYKNEHYDTQTHLWTNDKGKVCAPPPIEAYDILHTDLDKVNQDAVRARQAVIDWLDYVAYAGSHPWDI